MKNYQMFALLCTAGLLVCACPAPRAQGPGGNGQPYSQGYGYAGPYEQQPGQYGTNQHDMGWFYNQLSPKNQERFNQLDGAHKVRAMAMVREGGYNGNSARDPNDAVEKQWSDQMNSSGRPQGNGQNGNNGYGNNGYGNYGDGYEKKSNTYDNRQRRDNRMSSAEESAPAERDGQVSSAEETAQTLAVQ